MAFGKDFDRRSSKMSNYPRGTGRSSPRGTIEKCLHLFMSRFDVALITVKL